MDGRKRTVQIKFRVTEAERDLILEKMKLIPTRNMAAYLRKIAIDGYIVQVDHTDIKAMTGHLKRQRKSRCQWKAACRRGQPPERAAPPVRLYQRDTQRADRGRFG